MKSEASSRKSKVDDLGGGRKMGGSEWDSDLCADCLTIVLRFLKAVSSCTNGVVLGEGREKGTEPSRQARSQACL